MPTCKEKLKDLHIGVAERVKEIQIGLNFTLSVAVLGTAGVFSGILLLSGGSWGEVPFPTLRSLEVKQLCC